jgi:hypothetical protein
VETKTINYLFTIILRLTYWSKQAKHNLILLHFTNYQYDTNVLTTGIFNGAKGTVVGFGFTSDPTTSRGNSQIEIPIVFVKMDDDILAIAVASNPDTPAEIRNDIIKTSFWFQKAKIWQSFLCVMCVNKFTEVGNVAQKKTKKLKPLRHTKKKFNFLSIKLVSGKMPPSFKRLAH